jgi:hypothetical protein
MKYLNSEVSIIRSPEYVGADPVHRATWWNLSLYCAEQENGGVILGCRNWKCRRWQQTCGVTQGETQDACDLWEWDGDDLILWGYPLDHEEEMRQLRNIGKSTSTAKKAAARENGKKGGRPKTQRETQRETQNNPTETQKKPIQHNGKERKGREREDAHTLAANDLVLKLKSLRPSWAKPAILTHREKTLFQLNIELFESYDESDWSVQREYLAARLPEGDPSWQPLTLFQLLEWPADVAAHAARWKAKQRPALAVVKAPPTSNEPAATKAEIAAMFQSLKQA